MEEKPPQADGSGAAEKHAWLTAEFLERSLAEHTPRLRVTGFEVESAVGKGDNYASLMLRVRVFVVETEGEKERAGTRSLIVKSMPSGETSRKWVERAHLFPKEQRMYRETLPRMQRLLEERLAGQSFVHFIPRSVNIDTEGILVLEDLREQGFKMAQRRSGMDLAHCLMAMRALATFHALSVALREEEPSSVLYEESFYKPEMRDEFRDFLASSFDSLASKVEAWPGFERYAEKLRSFGSGIFDVIVKLMEETEEGFKVLNHGDFWVNNAMFKYSEKGKPMEIRFLDFQMCRYASLTMDLHYFLFSSPRADIRTEKMNEMLSVYHKTLGEVLAQLGLAHRHVSWEELQREVRRVMPFGVLSACNLLAIVLAEPADAVEFEDGLTEEEARDKMVEFMGKPMAGENFGQALRLLLPFFEKQGVL